MALYKRSKMIISFSIKPKDISGIKAYRIIREYCASKGITVSYVILKALNLYISEVINGKRQ